jgi:hypothetical protein
VRRVTRVYGITFYSEAGVRCGWDHASGRTLWRTIAIALSFSPYSRISSITTAEKDHGLQQVVPWRPCKGFAFLTHTRCVHMETSPTA